MCTTFGTCLPARICWATQKATDETPGADDDAAVLYPPGSDLLRLLQSASLLVPDTHHDQRDRPAGGLEGFIDAHGVPTLCEDSVHLWQRGQQTGNLLVGDAFRPVAVDRADDLDVGILGQDLPPPLVLIGIDRSTGDAAHLQDVPLAVQMFGKESGGNPAQLDVIERHLIGARRGRQGVEHDDRDALLAGVGDCPVQCCRRGRVDDNRLPPFQDQNSRSGLPAAAPSCPH